MLSKSQTEQLWLIFEGGCPARAGRTRRVCLGGRKVESAAIRLPQPRSRVKVKKREAFNSCGEHTTYQSTYSGVRFRSSSELPLIQLALKRKILGNEAPIAPEGWRDRFGDDSVPLFWQESKGISFWNSLLDDWRAGAIFDCSPGSGALMESALGRGTLYHGCCLSLGHSRV